MNLPDAPIAHEGFFATHFFTVRDQERVGLLRARQAVGTIHDRQEPGVLPQAVDYFLEPAQTVIPHGPDRDLTIGEALPARKRL